MLSPKWLRYPFAILLLVLAGCSAEQPTPSSSTAPAEEETLARTEFTERVENFFEYVPLKVNKPSVFRIHLTDLSDGAPVSMAMVTLSARPAGSSQVTGQTTARVGKVKGIYVADLTLSQPGAYDIEFHIHNDKLDERMLLTGFTAE